jgi:hypothetical protein
VGHKGSYGVVIGLGEILLWLNTVRHSGQLSIHCGMARLRDGGWDHRSETIPSLLIGKGTVGAKWEFSLRVLTMTFADFHCNFAYSALASFRMGTSGSASFHSVRKS